VPHQNLGPGGTLWSVPPQSFCRQMLLDPCYDKIRFRLMGLRPGLHWVSLHRSPDLLVGGQRASCSREPHPRLTPPRPSLLPVSSRLTIPSAAPEVDSAFHRTFGLSDNKWRW